MEKTATSPEATFQPSSYRPPNSRVGAFLWRRRMWFESTFALSMLEPWEKLLLITIMGLLWVFLLIGLFNYLPRHVVEMQQRTVYYLWGQEGDERLLSHWLGPNRSGFGTRKEL
ncbi:hypothetical protein PLICRDRAFT_144982 [Plicaturopsis crispa FD-325 SS-3]|nr:hypothetical protein PLICRDRAFT_144982 [Plicaturopsis crispa FD-325 SS-3]